MSSKNRLELIYASAAGPARPLTRDEALAGQRGRLMAGIAAAVARKGYAETTLADIVKHAGTSRRTFYGHFEDKQQCYLAAYERAVEYLLSQMAAAIPPTNDWRELCQATIHQYLAILSVEPEFARAFLVEVTSAGEAALDKRDEVHQQFGGFIQAIHALAQTQDSRVGALPDTVFVAIVAAINDLVVGYVRKGRVGDLPELEETVILLASGLFLGAGQAISPARSAKQAS